MNNGKLSNNLRPERASQMHDLLSINESYNEIKSIPRITCFD